ncbi:MAG: hypothetical protein JWM87_3489 [Candidatus Eremiobacteraeota bacterium]|nr:hypothetical protein [Candidatus Eremiobacteraeota bacterium]
MNDQQRRCVNCAQAIPADAAFCPRCGWHSSAALSKAPARASGAWWGWLVAILVVLGGLYALGGTKNATPASSDTPAITEDVTTPSGRTLHAVAVDGVLYAIDKAYVAHALGTQSAYQKQTNAHGEFIVVRVYADNRSSKSESASLHDAVLIDRTGAEYASSFDGLYALHEAGDDEALGTHDDLNPGLHRFVKQAFDVPDGLQSLTLKIPHRIFSGDKDGLLEVPL